MRFKYETQEQKLARIKAWRKHFCLLPVFQDGVCYWLETVEKRWEPFDIGTTWYQLNYGDYEYRAIALWNARKGEREEK